MKLLHRLAPIIVAAIALSTTNVSHASAAPDSVGSDAVQAIEKHLEKITPGVLNDTQTPTPESPSGKNIYKTRGVKISIPTEKPEDISIETQKHKSV